MYLKWKGMVEKVKNHMEPLKVMNAAKKTRGLGLAESDNESEVEIPDVLLEIRCS